jgi:nucleoside-diphosphate-sugar epimerase
MKILFIGGTGTISSSITKLIAETQGLELTVLNRGKRQAVLPENVRQITADISDEAQAREALEGEIFDVVADFIAFLPAQVERDIRLFQNRCKQYIFISSASAYQKPLSQYLITESTPLANPYWQYSRDKIACEEVLMRAYRDFSFPFTVVRPSHTYADGAVPLAIHGKTGPWSEIKRMLDNKPVIVPGDGLTLWTVTHSTDLAKAFVGLLGNVHAIGEAVHITSDESLTWNQIYETVGAALGVKPKLVHVSAEMLTALDPELSGGLLGDKSHSVIFDNSKIKRLVTGFTATTRFDQGIRQSIDCLIKRPDLMIEDPEWDSFIERVLEKVDRFIRE